MVITADELAGYWPDVEPMFRSFADRSRERHDVAHFRDAVEARRMQCWAVEGEFILAVGLTEVLDDKLNTVRFIGCAGRGAREWLFLMDHIKAWAKERGSKRFIAEARPGWERHLKPFGFQKTHVILEADL